uniref:Uncharacterized protein n=1 Tax=Avena sativa TaxID=4498 RepID=A0ACD5VXS0_AVESA
MGVSRTSWSDGGRLMASIHSSPVTTPSSRGHSLRSLEADLEIVVATRLACQDRCWTGERLERRRLPHRPLCVLCDQSTEFMSQLLTGCPFSRTIWHEVLSWIRSTAGPPVAEGPFAEWWELVVRSNPRQMRKGTLLVIILTAWWIWKHRNVIVFNNESPSVAPPVDMIKAEARSWAEAGA